MDLFVLYIAVFTVALLAVIEYRQYNTALTPFNVLAIPYLFIVLFVRLFGHYRGYYEITSESIIFVLINVAVFWIVGQAIRPLFGNESMPREVKLAAIRFISQYKKLLLVVLWCGILAGFFRLYKSVSIYGFNLVWTEEFTLFYRSGPLAHLTIWVYPIFMLLVALFIKKRDIRILLPLFLMLVVTLLTQVKYRTILLILSSFFFAIQSGVIRQMKIQHIISAVALITFIFITTYFVGFSAIFGVVEASKSLNLIITMFEDYLVGGPISLGYYLQGFENFLSPMVLLTAPANVIKIIFGNSQLVDPIIHHFVKLSPHGSIANNTGTLFATLYMTIGYYQSFWFMMLLGALTYSLYNATRTKQSIILYLITAQLLAILTVSFFGYHFHLLVLWEVGASSLLISYILLQLNRRGILPNN